jgi:hypothetical protein
MLVCLSLWVKTGFYLAFYLCAVRSAQCAVACFLCAVGFLSVLAYLDKQAQDNPFYLTFGEIEGYANACL